jgi:hypothetical protein
LPKERPKVESDSKEWVLQNNRAAKHKEPERAPEIPPGVRWTLASFSLARDTPRSVEVLPFLVEFGLMSSFRVNNRNDDKVRTGSKCVFLIFYLAKTRNV